MILYRILLLISIICNFALSIFQSIAAGVFFLLMPRVLFVIFILVPLFRVSSILFCFVFSNTIRFSLVYDF